MVGNGPKLIAFDSPVAKPSAKETFLHSSPTQRLNGLPTVAQRVFESAVEEARQQGLRQRRSVRRLTAPKGS